MHKSGRTLPSAHGNTDLPATRVSLLKERLRRQMKMQKSRRLLADLFEKALDAFEPAARPGVVAFATRADKIVELLEQ